MVVTVIGYSLENRASYSKKKGYHPKCLSQHPSTQRVSCQDGNDGLPDSIWKSQVFLEEHTRKFFPLPLAVRGRQEKKGTGHYTGNR